MEPVEPSGPKRGLQAAKEPLSLRFLLAFSASTVLTAAVAVPMAFQAHLAREEERVASVERPPVAVLGTTVVPDSHDHPAVSAEGLVHTGADGEQRPLDGAVLSGSFDLLVEVAGLERVDFVLDDQPVVTDHEAPWQPTADGEDAPTLAEGEHTLTATLRFADGNVELRRATFRVEAG